MALVALSLPLSGFVVGCAGRAKEQPVASLATTHEAKNEFRPLQSRWLLRDGAEELDSALLAFRARHPHDDLSRLAAVYLAWNAIARGELASARELIAEVREGPSGTTRDAAEIAEAGILRREGQAAEALAKLSRLVGKVIDPEMRALLNEELVQAAILSGRYFEAVGYVDLWLQQADGEERPAAREQIDWALGKIPPGVARAIVRAPSGSGYSQALRRRLYAKLDEEAEDASFTDFSLRDPAHVEGRKLGLLLSLGTTSQRNRSAEALSGVLHALELPHRDGDAPLLVTSNDGGDPTKTEAALSSLASLGVAMVIAGLDPPQASAAARFADQTSMPVVLLSPPEREGARPSSAFVVAGGEEGLPAKLVTALVSRGASELAWLGGPRDTPPEEAKVHGFCEDLDSALLPDARLQREKLESLLVLGDARCLETALSAMGARRSASMTVGVGLEAAARLAWSRSELGSVGAWLFPSVGLFPLREGDSASPLMAWVERYGAPPSYFAALARDAGMLASAALHELPKDRTSTPGDLAWRYAEAMRALEGAEAELFTTDARGFGSGHELPRSVRIMEIE